MEASVQRGYADATMSLRVLGTATALALCSCAPGQNVDNWNSTNEALTWTEHHRFVPSSGPGFGAFGRFVSLSGSHALISEHLSGDTPIQSGHAYVFSRTDGVWSEQQKLAPSTPFAFGVFGFGRAIQNDTALVGAPGEFNSRGAIYVFSRAGSSWSETEKLGAAQGEVSDSFGESLALDGATAVIGAPNAANGGRAYVFERGGDGFSETASLQGESTDAARFGSAVAIHGDTIVVGAPAGSVEPKRSGHAYVFQRSGGTFVREVLSADDGLPGNRFGIAVGIAGDTIAIGAPNKASSGEGETTEGVVYLFSKAGGGWQLSAKLSAAQPQPGDGFGVAVGLAERRLIVGAPWTDLAFSEQGSVSFFTHDGATWSQEQHLTASTAQGGAAFGISVSVDRTGLVVGSSDVLSGAAYGFSLLGAPCASASECAGGLCVDGVCCESACDGPCDSCNQAGQEGLCQPAIEKTPDPLCDPYLCGGSGSCTATCQTTADCAPDSACNASGECVAAPTADDAQTDEAGCGCRFSGNRHSMLWVLFLSLVLLRKRRRSR